jgi:hypothetical protein
MAEDLYICKGCGKEQSSDFTKGDDLIHVNAECTWKPSGRTKPDKATFKPPEGFIEDTLDDSQEE